MKLTSVFLPLALSFFLLAGFQTESQAQGIEFFHGTWAEAIAKAEKENKQIFVDAYTTWCGPCKWMAANVFTDPGVGKYYNDNFINVKMDMEKGEGPSLARKWSIRGYPTLLYFNPAGTESNRQLGGKSANDFINLGKKVVASKS